MRSPGYGVPTPGRKEYQPGWVMDTCPCKRGERMHPTMCKSRSYLAGADGYPAPRKEPFCRLPTRSKPHTKTHEAAIVRIEGSPIKLPAMHYLVLILAAVWNDGVICVARSPAVRPRTTPDNATMLRQH